MPPYFPIYLLLATPVTAVFTWQGKVEKISIWDSFLLQVRFLPEVKYKTKTQSEKRTTPVKSPFSYYHMKKKNISNSEAVPNGSADFRDFKTLTDWNSCCLPEGFKRFSLLK